MLILILAALTIAYTCFAAFLYLAQERLIFSGAKPNHLLYHQLCTWSRDLINEGIRLQGWKVPGNNPSANAVVIFFGGNAQDVAGATTLFTQFPVEFTYSFNYRGYGLSEGHPSEAAMYRDALFIFDTIVKQNPGKSVAVIGQSLGSAVAGYVAAQRKVKKLVIITPISSIKDMVRSRFKNLFPPLLVKHDFRLHQYAKSVHCDTLVIIAERDTIVPRAFSLKTYHAIGGPKTLLDVVGAEHTTIMAPDQTVSSIKQFLGTIQNPKVTQPAHPSP